MFNKTLKENIKGNYIAFNRHTFLMEKYEHEWIIDKWQEYMSKTKGWVIARNGIHNIYMSKFQLIWLVLLKYMWLVVLNRIAYIK